MPPSDPRPDSPGVGSEISLHGYLPSLTLLQTLSVSSTKTEYFLNISDLKQTKKNRLAFNFTHPSPLSQFHPSSLKSQTSQKCREKFLLSKLGITLQLPPYCSCPHQILQTAPVRSPKSSECFPLSDNLTPQAALDTFFTASFLFFRS